MSGLSSAADPVQLGPPNLKYICPIGDLKVRQLEKNWSKRGNINTAALVTIAQCNTLVARCSRQLIGEADWVFVTQGPLRCD